MSQTQKKPIKIDIGSGHIRTPGFVRVDIDPDAEPDVLCDLMDVADHFEEKSADEVRAYHVLEHVPPGETFRAIRTWRYLLRPGGTLDIVVPDIDWAMCGYADGSLPMTVVLKTLYGADPTATQWMPHLTGFSRGALKRMFAVTGFIKIEHSYPKEGELHVRGVRPE